MTSRQVRLAYGAWIAVCLIWGTTYLGIKIALETMPPMLMGGLRFALAGAVLSGALLALGHRLPHRRTWGGLAVLGFLMLGLGNGGVVWAEVWLPSGLTAIVVATTPFWMVAIEALLPSGERLHRRHLAGLTVGFAGTALLLWPELAAAGPAGAGTLAGVIALQIACCGWALGSAYSRRHAREESAIGAAALQMTFGGLFLVAAGTIFGEWGSVHFNTRTGAAFGYLLFVGAIGGYAAYIYALKYLPVSTVSLYAYINPAIAVVLGALLLAEPLHARMVVAAAIILAGVALVRSAPVRGRREAAPDAPRPRPVTAAPAREEA